MRIRHGMPSFVAFNIATLRGALYAIWSKWKTSKDEALCVGVCVRDLRFAYVQNSMKFEIAQKSTLKNEWAERAEKNTFQEYYTLFIV